MTTRANVHSLAAIEAVRTELVEFVDQIREALTMLDGEMRRTVDWLEDDRPKYWKAATRRAVDGVNEAQQALHRCLMFPIAGERPACSEERAALKKAKARLAYCEEKMERVRHWQAVLRHELFEYQGRISQLVRLVDIDGPRAIGVLHKILRQLEEYQRVRLPYNDRELVTMVWGDAAQAATDGDAASDVPTAADGEVASATGNTPAPEPEA